jgi:hypothetical protein
VSYATLHYTEFGVLVVRSYSSSRLLCRSLACVDIRLAQIILGERSFSMKTTSTPLSDLLIISEVTRVSLNAKIVVAAAAERDRTEAEQKEARAEWEMKMAQTKAEKIYSQVHFRKRGTTSLQHTFAKALGKVDKFDQN